jgi:hypothetical protein
MQNEPTPNKTAPAKPPRQMHGCLTTWLWLIIIGNITGVLITVFGPAFIDLPELPSWYLPVSIAATACVIVCAAALLRWKVWGFWGLVALEGISVLISIAESGNYFSIGGALMGVAILVMLLNIGGDKKAWNYLE